jgi:hypothetical protein
MYPTCFTLVSRH